MAQSSLFTETIYIFNIYGYVGLENYHSNLN